MTMTIDSPLMRDTQASDEDDDDEVDSTVMNSLLCGSLSGRINSVVRCGWMASKLKIQMRCYWAVKLGSGWPTVYGDVRTPLWEIFGEFIGMFKRGALSQLFSSNL